MARLVATDAAGNVVATLDKRVVVDEDGRPALVDFEAMQDSGLELTLVWRVSDAVRSKAERETGPQGPTDAPRRLVDLPLVGRGR
jgi:hypothetical protein